MKFQNITLALFVSFLLFSCAPPKKADGEKGAQTEAEKQTEAQTDSIPAPEEAGLSVEDIDQIRADIEALELEAVEVTTSNLRAKTKQKWSKIHFYVKDGSIVKIKTYPYANLSKRTEEFYANEKGLVLAVIEDNGEGGKGKPKNELDKLYYFSGGILIKEINKEENTEYTIKESDAEELQSEFKEYLDVYKYYIEELNGAE
jgi:hypothetical protein